MTISKHKEYGSAGSLTSNPTSSEWNEMVEIIQDSGSNLKTKSIQISSDETIDLSGGTGSAYLKYNDTTKRLEVWVGGSKKEEWS